jgi:hypothetical protein
VKSLEAELNRCLNDSDPLLREIARGSKRHLTPELENKKLPNSGQAE